MKWSYNKRRSLKNKYSKSKEFGFVQVHGEECKATNKRFLEHAVLEEADLLIKINHRSRDELTMESLADLVITVQCGNQAIS